MPIRETWVFKRTIEVAEDLAIINSRVSSIKRGGFTSLVSLSPCPANSPIGPIMSIGGIDRDLSHFPLTLELTLPRCLQCLLRKCSNNDVVLPAPKLD